MSYDLAIWKRSDTTKTAMLAEAFLALSEGRSHPAMQKFELEALETALDNEFGYVGNMTCMIACASGGDANADWMLVQCNFPDAETVVSRVVPIALDLGLLVYDPQRECVWGNKRPPKANRRK